MTVDPVRDGTNWYQYVNSNPVNLWDPLGASDKNIFYKKFERVLYFSVFHNLEKLNLGIKTKA